MTLGYIYLFWIFTLVISVFWVQKFWPKKNVTEKYSYSTRVFSKLPGNFWLKDVEAEDIKFFKKFRKKWLLFWIYFISSGAVLYFISGMVLKSF